jgi:hypothetical protein
MSKITNAARMIGAILLAVNAGMNLAKTIREHADAAMPAARPGSLDAVLADALKRARDAAADSKGGTA